MPIRSVFRRPSPVSVYNNGPHSTPVFGTAKIGTPSNTPQRSRVRLHDQPTGALLREAWSDATTGQGQFVGLRSGTFYVVAFDHTGQYGGVIETDVVLPTPGA